MADSPATPWNLEGALVPTIPGDPNEIYPNFPREGGVPVIPAGVTHATGLNGELYRLDRWPNVDGSPGRVYAEHVGGTEPPIFPPVLSPTLLSVSPESASITTA